MNSSEFVVSLADLERGPKHVTWPVLPAWLHRALDGTEASPGEQPGSLEVELSKNGREVMARGNLVVGLTMPCSRTLEPVPVEVNSEIFLLLSPATEPDAGARRPRRAERSKGASPKGKGAQKPAGKKSGAGWSEDPVLSDSDAARDTYSGETVVLDRFVREFLLLELPMVPMQKGLPSEEPPTIAASSDGSPAERPVDPRLLPLVAIASRLRGKE
ncbi:MAG TPA: YceD family protein [Polyangiaceae bacterium]